MVKELWLVVSLAKPKSVSFRMALGLLEVYKRFSGYRKKDRQVSTLAEPRRTVRNQRVMAAPSHLPQSHLSSPELHTWGTWSSQSNTQDRTRQCEYYRVRKPTVLIGRTQSECNQRRFCYWVCSLFISRKSRSPQSRE